MTSPSWNPTHLHIKSGGEYMLIGEGRIEATMAPCIIYRSASGQFWVRPSAEFRERFAPIIKKAGVELEGLVKS